MAEREKRNIGEILKGLGRITQEDIEIALAHQREHGGFFGAALVTCGIVSEEEIEFGLASQFDLPYLFPDADAVDLEAASLVTPEWALEHLTLPIVRTDETLQVVIDSPLKVDALEELRERTGLELELGLASPATIRELIRQVHARATALDAEPKEPLSLENVLDVVRDAGASRWGISVRASRAQAWWNDHGTIRRRTLAGDWADSLEGSLEPQPSHMVTETRAEWDALVGRGDSTTHVRAHCIADESGREYLFVPRGTENEEVGGYAPPPPGIVSEIEMLARAGTARFAVTADPPKLGHEILPHLPELVFDPSWRNIHLNDGDPPGAARAFSVRLPGDPTTWGAEIAALKIFHFDAVTVDLSGGDGSWAPAAVGIASVAFLHWPETSTEGAWESGIRYHLFIREADSGALEWTLEPLES
ncbi:MAG: hypothetical protein HKN72_04360 [Gemmatimonadetes bacterium]|nr:hypothetical protein [Gemmatimonadota bacterium]NNF12427.1 hypothetical protein [Gemmatimonadota bacterium]NNL29752.1 hypothetical protein [Gemmatimonadota bacterium]